MKIFQTKYMLNHNMSNQFTQIPNWSKNSLNFWRQNGHSTSPFQALTTGFREELALHKHSISTFQP